MKFGYIKINGSVSQIFLDTPDKVIQERVSEIKNAILKTGVSVDISWNQLYSEKTIDELIVFLEIR